MKNINNNKKYNLKMLFTYLISVIILISNISIMSFANAGGSEEDKERINVEEEVDRWIRENISPAETVYMNSSYGLKHVFERDMLKIGKSCYISNDDFKAAMIRAGYEPINPDELNHVYRIILNCEINNGPFFQWVMQFINEDSPYGDFAKDIKDIMKFEDESFPIEANHGIIKEHLKRFRASDGVMDIFEELWRQYKEEGGRVEEKEESFEEEEESFEEEKSFEEEEESVEDM